MHHMQGPPGIDRMTWPVMAGGPAKRGPQLVGHQVESNPHAPGTAPAGQVRGHRFAQAPVQVADVRVGSVGEETEAVLLKSAVSAEAVLTTNVNTWGPEPAGSVPMSAVMVPLAPTAVMSVRLQPFRGPFSDSGGDRPPPPDANGRSARRLGAGT